MWKEGKEKEEERGATERGREFGEFREDEGRRRKKERGKKLEEKMLRKGVN